MKERCCHHYSLSPLIPTYCWSLQSPVIRIYVASVSNGWSGIITGMVPCLSPYRSIHCGCKLSPCFLPYLLFVFKLRYTKLEEGTGHHGLWSTDHIVIKNTIRAHSKYPSSFEFSDTVFTGNFDVVKSRDSIFPKKMICFKLSKAKSLKQECLRQFRCLLVVENVKLPVSQCLLSRLLFILNTHVIYSSTYRGKTKPLSLFTILHKQTWSCF